ncbi:MAG: site-specific DNA-methyltransferase [Chloroflexi bacterium]|nr:site-specific DNA-methyltransferase [Chloroflexota bacterium]
MSNTIRKLYRGDCLDILRDYIQPESVDLIYLDPPFNSNAKYNLPFKGKDKGYEPVEAFVDTWTWTADDDARLAEFRKLPEPRPTLAMIVEVAQRIEQVPLRRGSRRKRQNSLAAYLLNMSERLLAMKAVLKPTGSIYLHCDWYASHYLKATMDATFQKENFRNEIIWCYTGPSNTTRWFPRKHDTILFYTNGDQWEFNRDDVRVPYSESYVERFKKKYKEGAGKSTIFSGGHDTKRNQELAQLGKVPEDWWAEFSPVGRSNEYLGYPTQKPLALLERIIKTSSNEGDVVLDPFCGCGTTAHAAEQLNRQWIGIDISRFSTELMRERILTNYPARIHADGIEVVGLPGDVDEARELARGNPFEFEKWVCGRIGVNDMGRRKVPGARGADGGIDGEIRLPVVRDGIVYEESVVVQVKGGNVTPDAVKALSETVRRVGSVAGVMVCFNEQMGTVENQRSRETWDGGFGNEYPIIQGYSVDDLLRDKPLNLPPQYGRKRGGRISA